MQKATHDTSLFKAIGVLIGALLMGFLWRVRGETGWGSSWGLLNAGFVFTLFIILAKGERKKLNLYWLSLTALSFMLTVPSWGTLLHQITGVLYEPELPTTDDAFVYIPVWTGVALMLSLGFGLATIFGIMLGRGYSDKQWQVKDFIILLAVFYITDIITKATVSHWILGAIQPEAVDFFKKGLNTAGIDENIYKLYLQHFNDLSWAKKFDGGRNYFSSVQAISSVFRSAAALLATRFIIKDKVSANTGAVVSCAFAFAITISDLFFYFSNGGYHMLGESPFTSFVSAWGCWEFFTGFIAGGIITAYMINLKNTENVSELAFSRIPEKPATVMHFILGFVFIIGVSIVRPVLERFDGSDHQIIATAIAVLIAIVLVIVLNTRYGINANKLTMTQLANLLLPVFSLYIIVVYIFIAAPEERNIANLGQLQNLLSVTASLAVVVWCFFNKKITKLN